MTTREIAGFAAAYPDLDCAAVDYEYLRAVSQEMVPFGRHVGTLITEIGPGPPRGGGTPPAAGVWVGTAGWFAGCRARRRR
ncbi:hypothetical protein [Nocardia abscessus]|uniref:hypothetical protein n=1 Tax=Nocardia abscessus TaxID=120957 RepID=UPI002458A26C|nr:hypothetical protein [Nocardia abscessus]